MSVELKDVTVQYRGSSVPVLERLDLLVPTGTSLALMGPSGAGKSTALSVAGLLMAPTSGEVWIGGRKREVRDAAEVLGTEVAWALQTVSLLPRRSVIDNVTLSELARGARRAQVEARARELLALVGIDDVHQVARTLSGGQAQRVGIARALLAEPAVLIADEPTANLDLATGREIARTLLRAFDGVTVLLATHDPEVAQMADRVVHLEPAGSRRVAAR